MQIQKQNNVSFKQKYVVPYELDLFTAINLVAKFRPFFDFAQEGHVFTHIDSTNKKLYLATGEDCNQFLDVITSSQPPEESFFQAISSFFTGAIELGHKTLEELKKPLIDMTKNYKVQMQDNSKAKEILSTLKHYLSSIGINASNLTDEYLCQVNVAVPLKDLSEYSRQIAQANGPEITIGESSQMRDNIVKKYLSGAQEFGKTDADKLINSVRKILGLGEI